MRKASIEDLLKMTKLEQPLIKDIVEGKTKEAQDVRDILLRMIEAELAAAKTNKKNKTVKN